MKKIIVSLCFIFILIIALSAEEEIKEKGFLLPLILNTYPGFGIGSFFLQGDTTGGIMLIVSDAAGGSLFLTGYFIYIAAFYSDGADSRDKMEKGIITCIIGGSIFIASKIFGIIRPIWFAADYNAALQKKQAMIEIFPTVAQVPNNQKLQLGIHLRMVYSYD